MGFFIIGIIQLIRSHETEILQLTDLLIGALGHLYRGEQKSAAKQALISRIIERSHYSLMRSTLLMEKKFNIFRWRSKEK